MDYKKNAPYGAVTSIATRPYQTQVFVPGDNTAYIAFIMRQQMTLYNGARNVCGSVAAGKRALCKSGMVDLNNPYLMAINYAEKRTGGWDPMADSTGSYGYVDTGMRAATGANGIALYGNW